MQERRERDDGIIDHVTSDRYAHGSGSGQAGGGDIIRAFTNQRGYRRCHIFCRLISTNWYLMPAGNHLAMRVHGGRHNGCAVHFDAYEGACVRA